MATLNLFPARIRFTNTDGTLTPEAYRALQVLFERVGGPLGDNGADTFGDLNGVASLDMSLTDTVTQPVVVEAFAPDVVQPVQADKVVGDVVQPVGAEPFMPDVVQPPNEDKAFDLAAAINAATSKATPVDADVLPVADSASGFTLKKLTWANIKATLAAWLNGNLIPASFTSLAVNGPLSVIQGITGGFAASKSFTQYESASVARDYTCGADTATYGEYYKYVAKSNGTPVSAYSITSTSFRIHQNLTILGSTTFMTTSNTLTNYAGAGAATMTNGPAAGNPTKWIAINDAGVTRYIPTW